MNALCPVCNNLKRIKENSSLYYDTCEIKDIEHKKFINKLKQKRTIFNCLKKYGVSSPNRVEHIKAKKKKTLMNNYGVVNPMKSDFVKDKQRSSMLEKYGVSYNSQRLSIKKKLSVLQKLRMSDIIYKHKVFKNNLQKYGPFYKDNLKAKTYAQKHIRNTYNLTKEYIEDTFLDYNKNLLILEMQAYFNIKRTTCYKYIRTLDIDYNSGPGGFDPNKHAILYYIWDPVSDLYKIGITNRTVQERFGKTFCSDRAIAILEQTEYLNGLDAYSAEQEILEAFNYARCVNDTWPEKLGGKTEFFNEDILRLNPKY